MHILMKHNSKLTELTAKSKEQDNTINTLVKFVNSERPSTPVKRVPRQPYE